MFTEEQIKLIYLRFKNINYSQEQLSEHIVGNQIVEVIEKYYLQNAQKNGKAEKQEKVAK